jgi:hypothetical protein
METVILKEMIGVIRAEQQRRASLLADQDPNFAYDQWVFKDEPFVNELCLMLLVTLRHQVERELVRLAARAADGGGEISGQQYQEKVKQLRKRLRERPREYWKEIEDRLKLKSFCEEYKSMEALRFLANSYKHNPSMKPDKALLKSLKLETKVNYAPLPESDSLREGFAALIGFGKDADYCDIAERFIDIANDFLVKVKGQIKLIKVNWGTVSLNPNDFAR